MAGVSKFNLPGGLRGRPARILFLAVGGALFLMIFAGSCTAYVAPNEVAILESRLIPPRGIQVRGGKPFEGGRIRLLLPGQRMHTFPTDIQVLDLTSNTKEVVRVRNQRIEPAMEVNTSDGSRVKVDVTVLYRITDPLTVMRTAGPGRLFETTSVLPKTIASLKKNLGEMVAEDFYDVHKRVAKAKAAQEQIAAELADKGIAVEQVLLRQYYYDGAYQQQIEEKKIQDQLKFTRQSEAEAAKELAKKQEIEATGQANVDIETERGRAEVTKIRAEADAYRRKRVAEADLLVQLATAKGTELENAAYSGIGSENLVGLEMAEVLGGLETILVPSGGKSGVNPLDLEQSLKMFDVK